MELCLGLCFNVLDKVYAIACLKISAVQIVNVCFFIENTIITKYKIYLLTIMCFWCISRILVEVCCLILQILCGRNTILLLVLTL